MHRPRLVGVLGVCVLALVLAGCETQAAVPDASSPTAAPTRSASPSSSATAAVGGELVTSTQYGYSVVLPTGWAARPATLGWDGGDVDHTAEYADRFTDADGNEYFVIGTATEEPVDAFASAHLAWLAENRGCPSPGASRTVSVDGVRAERVAVHCPDGVFGPTLVSKVIVVKDGTAVIITSFSPDTGSDDFPPLDALADSVQWSEGS
jgi:hypothetical protein